MFQEILASKDLEISKDSIVKASWKRPGFFDGARFLINTKQGDFQITSAPTRVSLGVIQAINNILGSLAEFIPDRLYNEKGELVYEKQMEWIRAQKKNKGKASSAK
jgi:hypothetical protein